MQSESMHAHLKITFNRCSSTGSCTGKPDLGRLSAHRFSPRSLVNLYLEKISQNLTIVHFKNIRFCFLIDATYFLSCFPGVSFVSGVFSSWTRLYIVPRFVTEGLCASALSVSLTSWNVILFFVFFQFQFLFSSPSGLCYSPRSLDCWGRSVQHTRRISCRRNTAPTSRKGIQRVQLHRKLHRNNRPR